MADLRFVPTFAMHSGQGQPAAETVEQDERWQWIQLLDDDGEGRKDVYVDA